MQELLVGMVISSIIIGMMYTIYVQINEQMLGHNKNQQELMEFNQFRQILSKDMLLAKSIEGSNEKEFKLTFNKEDYTYTLNENMIIRDRNNSVKDTFNLVFTRMEIKEDDKDGAQGNKTLLLTTKLLGEEIILFESKSIANANQINDLYLNEY
jgi:hypothetical protein